MNKFIALVFTALLFVSCGNDSGVPNVVDHRNLEISDIPEQWITAAKTNLKVWYGHTSHGSQITTGMEVLRTYADYGTRYNFNSDGSGGALSYQEYSGDLGGGTDTAWIEATRDQLGNAPQTNVVMWSWCGGVSEASEDDINTYLRNMSALESDFPNVTFIYMTGHLDGTGSSGNLHLRNEQIRRYCINNGKKLFDFADIESYDPSGSEFLSRDANDNCDYSGNNWATQWVSGNPSNILALQANASGECAHSQGLNCVMKGRAFWWLLAKIAGWN